jgi:hypothetical protein
MEAKHFNKFLDKSCSRVVMGTVMFAGMSISIGLMAMILVVGAKTCRHQRWSSTGPRLRSRDI